MDMRSQIGLTRRREATLMGLALSVALFATACDDAIIDYDLVLANQHPVEAHVSAQPGKVCPGELVLVEWDGGTDPPECADTSTYSASCKQPSLRSTDSLLVSRELTGSERVPIHNRTTFDFTVLRNEVLATDRAVVDVVSGEEDFPLTFGEECIDRHWQWTLQSPSLSSTTTACMSVTQVCAYGGPGLWIYVARADGVAAPLRSGTCTPVVFNGNVVDFRAMDAADLDSGPRPCNEAMTGPGPESTPREPIHLVISIGCPGPDDPSPDGCERVMTAALTSAPGGPSDEGLATFCNLEETCGDGVCDAPCEDADVCDEDCAAESQAADEPVQQQSVEAICGDGTLSPEEECEADTDCTQGFFCGFPGTNAECICIPTCGDGLCAAYESAASCPADCGPVCGDGVVTHNEQCDNGGCADGFTCTSDCICQADALPGADGLLCGDGICQAGESPDWCGDCSSGDEGGEEPPPQQQPPPPPPPPPQPVCGDGVCEASEQGCGVCSADCGPC